MLAPNTLLRASLTILRAPLLPAGASTSKEHAGLKQFQEKGECCSFLSCKGPHPSLSRSCLLTALLQLQGGRNACCSARMGRTLLHNALLAHVLACLGTTMAATARARLQRLACAAHWPAPLQAFPLDSIPHAGRCICTLLPCHSKDWPCRCT